MYKNKRWYLFFKRLMDIAISLFGIILFCIPTLIFAGIIWIQDPGSPFFRQLRVGKNGKTFYIIKLRTMRQNAPHECPTNQLQNLSEWILPIGFFLRKSSLDEIPQFISILMGKMSLIGPRPLILAEEEMHRLRMENNVYALRPGLTGLAQINGRDDISMQTKLDLDIEYTQNCGLLLDLKILWKTASQLFNKTAFANVR